MDILFVIMKRYSIKENNKKGPIVKKNIKLEELLNLPQDVIKAHSKMLKGEGIFLIILGIAAITLPLLFAVAIEFILGTLFILAAFAGLARSFKAKNIPGTLFSIMTYILFLIAGITIIATPLLGVQILAVLLASFFIVSGFFKIIFAFHLKPGKGWGWALFDGVTAMVLGIVLFRTWPLAIWIVGIIVGIRLVILGNAMLMIANGLNKKS
jgi:uncharacterized membrane protein HdeD (DUF308 family)